MTKKFGGLSISPRVGYLIRRCFAYAIDWYIVAVLSNIMIMVLQQIFKSPGTTNEAIILVVSVMFVSFIYYVFVPYKVWKGQTFMQRAMQVKVVNDDLSNVEFSMLMKRFFVGCLIFEGAAYTATTITLNVVIKMFFVNYAKTLDLVFGGILFLSTVLSMIIASRDTRNSKCFHDHVAKTKVIDIKTIS